MYKYHMLGFATLCANLQKTTLPPLSFSPQCAAFNPRDSNHRCHGALPRDGLLIAILRGRIETWKEEVDRNLSWFNQLVRNCCFKWVVGLWVGTVLIPLQATESSSMGQGRRQG